jgi:hypothetical protein
LYIPGYGDINATRELRELKMRTDSLEQAVKFKDEYLDNIKNVLQGDVTVKPDTTALNIPKSELIQE